MQCVRIAAVLLLSFVVAGNAQTVGNGPSPADSTSFSDRFVDNQVLANTLQEAASKLPCATWAAVAGIRNLTTTPSSPVDNFAGGYFNFSGLGDIPNEEWCEALLDPEEDVSEPFSPFSFTRFHRDATGRQFVLYYLKFTNKPYKTTDQSSLTKALTNLADLCVSEDKIEPEDVVGLSECMFARSEDNGGIFTMVWAINSAVVDLDLHFANPQGLPIITVSNYTLSSGSQSVPISLVTLPQ